MTTVSPQELNESDFQQAVSDGLALVDFWAPWCGPCRLMGPVLQNLAQREDQLLVAKVNVDANPNLAAEYRVQAIPLLVLLRDGDEIDRFVGLQSLEALTDAIRRHAK